MLLGWIILLVPIVLVLYGIGLYNRLIYLRLNRQKAFADIDVQLKQRADLVPSLVETVKGYAAHEKSIFEAVTAARAGVQGKTGSGDDRIAAEQRLSGALTSLYAVAENYPALKADANFQQLMAELADIENKIAAARRFFNNTTGEYNTMSQQFPASIIAKMYKFGPETFYEDTSVPRATLEKAPSVQF